MRVHTIADIQDWQNEVANGVTLLGFFAWFESREKGYE